VDICDPKANCEVRQDETLPLPEYLFAEVEQMVIKELTMLMSVPVDSTDDGQNILR
jgi:hypothetical protein